MGCRWRVVWTTRVKTGSSAPRTGRNRASSPLRSRARRSPRRCDERLSAFKISRFIIHSFICQVTTTTGCNSTTTRRYHTSETGLNHPVRKIICTPLSVSTAPLNSPTLNAIVASSNGFCICPGPNSPRSPPRFALEQSETLCANASNVVAPLSICSLYAFNSSNAASFVCVFACVRE